MRALLARGATLEAATSKGCRAVHMAAMKGRPSGQRSVVTRLQSKLAECAARLLAELPSLLLRNSDTARSAATILCNDLVRSCACRRWS